MRSIVLASLVWSALAGVAGAQSPTTCPFGIPVVSLPLDEANGFAWRGPIRPLGDPCVAKMLVDPLDSQRWYVVGQFGLYVTHDAGRTWAAVCRVSCRASG